MNNYIYLKYRRYGLGESPPNQNSCAKGVDPSDTAATKDLESFRCGAISCVSKGSSLQYSHPWANDETRPATNRAWEGIEQRVILSLG